MFTLEQATVSLRNPCHRPMEEPEEHEGALKDPSAADVADNVVSYATQQLASLDLDLLEPDCEGVLETIDSCVDFVGGVDEQRMYEEKMIENARHRKAAVEQHGLSEKDAALIRLHIMEEGRDDTNRQVHDSSIPDLDLLNFCGNDVDLADVHETFVINSTPEADLMACTDIGLDGDNMMMASRNDNELRDGIVSGGQTLNALQCAICFDEALTGGSLNRVKFASLPCCGGSKQEGIPATDIKVCTSCILVLTTPSSAGDQRVGRCPRCLSWIQVQIPKQKSEKKMVAVQKINISGQCLVCNQKKEFLVDNDTVCDSCFLGRRQPLKYECQQCHGTQNIPHPMYRYQKAQDEFGNVTWACQQKCGRFTNWKIVPEDLHRIPLGDAPKSWETDYITLARSRVKILRADLVNETSASNRSAQGTTMSEDPSQCLIL